jgi:hypothetical protein
MDLLARMMCFFQVRQDEHDQSVNLARRYHAVCGVTGHKDLFGDEELAEDQERFAHLIKIEDGMLALDELEGAGYMAELSLMSVAECRKVLLEVWDRSGYTV